MAEKATLPELYEPLRDAANAFRGYAMIFRNEGTEIGRKRAVVADELASEAEAALAKAGAAIAKATGAA